MTPEYKKSIRESAKKFNARGEWQFDLIDKYSHILNEDEMYRYGFSCGTGWKPIIEWALESLANLDSLPQPLQIVQIKEKFGGLRIYTNFSSDEIRTIIKTAEDWALKTCMYCSTTDKVSLRTEKWWLTLCDSCNEIRENQYHF